MYPHTKSTSEMNKDYTKYKGYKYKRNLKDIKPISC